MCYLVESETMAPTNTEERIVWYSMVGTYVFYLFGALYIVAPVIAWILFAVALKRIVFWHLTADNRYFTPLPITVLIWFIGMFVMLIALIVGHITNNYGLGSIIKSTIGWAKGWALLALFPLIGCLNIRPELIYRAACNVCLQTLILVPIFVLAWLAGLPEVLYVSPLKAVGGPGPEFFSVNLYEIDPGSGSPRWRLFTPWAPAVGFVANIYFIFALHEKNFFWKTVGLIGCLVMILMSGSRLALVAVVFVPVVAWGMSMLARPLMLGLAGIGTALLGIVAVPMIVFAEQAMTAFREARIDSSRVRAALGRIALQRWRTEAPIWGHGQVEAGPHMVEFMLIGSHHSWYGLLFVKGIVGLLALAIPMLISFLFLWFRSFHLVVGRVGLSMVLILFLYTFGENLEVLAYLIWPALVMIGLAAAQKNDQTLRS